MRKKTEKFNIVLLEDVCIADSHGMNFMTKGSKGVLMVQGEAISTVKIQRETYELPNTSFIELTEEVSEDKAA